MTDAQKRMYVSDLYSGPKWKKRVAKWSDDQVTAVYLAHLEKGIRPRHKESVQKRLLNEVPRDPHRNEDLFETY
jgi:hypothetical protein